MSRGRPPGDEAVLRTFPILGRRYPCGAATAPLAWHAAVAVGCGLMIWIAVVTLLAPARRYCGVSVLGG